jgi:hypothetical protein
MGHTRLGWIPKSKKWSAVVGMVAGEYSGASLQHSLIDDVNLIAAETLIAAEAGLTKAIDDPGLKFTFYLLTQLVLAARKDNWKESLAKLGINIKENATLFELNADFQGVVDRHVFEHYRVTDINEIAIKAAGEALTSIADKIQINLFGNNSDELKSAIRELSTKKGFSDLGQKFFGSFMTRYLNFYLSRITAAKTGDIRIKQVGEVTSFNRILQTHCEQSSRIVYEFCGQWYSKTEFKEGINLDNTSKFLAVAIKKLQAELKQQRADI